MCDLAILSRGLGGDGHSGAEGILPHRASFRPHSSSRSIVVDPVFLVELTCGCSRSR